MRRREKLDKKGSRIINGEEGEEKERGVGRGGKGVGGPKVLKEH